MACRTSGTNDGRQIEMLGRGRLPYFDQDGVHQIYREWRPILDEYGAIGVAEAWVESPQRLPATSGLTSCTRRSISTSCSPTSTPNRSARSSTSRSRRPISSGAPTTWVLSNHDKHRHVTRYGSLARAKAATLLMLALPGSAYLYNGEELGLDEVLDLPDELREDPAFKRTGESRDGCRVPIPWTEDAWTHPWLPFPHAGWRSPRQAGGRSDSTLNFYRERCAYGTS
jgi:alpha-glucosidase